MRVFEEVAKEQLLLRSEVARIIACGLARPFPRAIADTNAQPAVQRVRALVAGLPAVGLEAALACSALNIMRKELRKRF